MSIPGRLAAAVSCLVLTLAAGCGSDTETGSDESCIAGCEVDCAGVAGGTAFEDECGVCVADPADACEADCAGTWGGSAFVDECGACVADAAEACEQDCAGTWGGSAFVDECGACVADAAEACEQDCAGTWGGDAFVDECGACVADPAEACEQDCAGTWGGDAFVDECGACVADPAEACALDCAGTWGGDAFRDECGACIDDPADACVQDCAGRWGGDAFRDECGACIDDAADACVQDCAGVWGGDAFVDTCGTCVTDPADACVQDCAGVWGGDAEEVDGTCVRRAVLPAESTVSVSYWQGTRAGAEMYVTKDSQATGGGRALLRFDLRQLPAGAIVHSVALRAVAFTGMAWGGDGNVYTHFVADDAWTSSITWSTQPAFDIDAPLGHWFLWYNFNEARNVATNASPLLVPVVQREFDGDGQLSFVLRSPGYDTTYHSHLAADPADRPTLELKYTLP